MIETTEKKSVSERYEFAEFVFYPKDSKIIFSNMQNEVFLRRNVGEFLLLLVINPHSTVTYKEFRDGVEAWQIYKDILSLIRTIHLTKGELQDEVNNGDFLFGIESSFRIFNT